MKRFSARLTEFPFEFEFLDGSKAEFKFRDLNTKQIQEFSKVGDMSDDERYELHIKLLEENILGDEELKEKMIEELEEYGNIFEFVAGLQEELGKRRKRR